MCLFSCALFRSILQFSLYSLSSCLSPKIFLHTSINMNFAFFTFFHPHQLDKRIFHIFPIYLIFSCSHVSLDTFPRFHFQDSPVPCSNRSPLIFSCFSFFQFFTIFPGRKNTKKKIIAKRDFSPILSVQRLLTNCFKNCGIAIVLLSFVRLLHARARAREKKKKFL